MKIYNAVVQKNVVRMTEKLLMAHGIRGWNMDNVARDTGMAKNTLYRIIGTKEQLLERITIDRLRSRVDAIVEVFRKEKDFLKAVEIGTDQLVRGIAEDNPRMLTQVFREYPAIREKFDSIAASLSTSIHRYLNSAKRSGIIRRDVDNDVLIATVTAVINHYITLNLSARDLEERMRKALAYILTGIVP
ncbi:MAG: TetR/AcrR family transcriptional regulator [Spirochaetes bacterium]|nr:TetR/AcrR family transcriptional regulator [Spirochaetota bacterium]